MSETKIIPLGGLGQFGANATIVKTQKTTVLIDFGLMFPPDKRQPGVDFYINDPEELLRLWPGLEAIFITHGHEDHIGGLFYLLKRKSIPVYATAYTGALIASADPMIPHPDIREIAPGEPVVLGDISVEYIPVTHSIAEASCLHLQTPGGSILHSGDFKLDPLQGDDHHFGTDRISEIAADGLDLLMMDSTNSSQAGFSGSESELLDTFHDIIQSSKGRLLISSFSSSFPRLINISRLAEKQNRKVALMGRSFFRHFEAAIKAGYLAPSQIFISLEEAALLPAKQIIYFVTGSQGEINAALTKIAFGKHRDLKLRSSDTVVFSSKAIPGNERAIGLLKSQLEQSGATVITSAQSHVHVSGHAYREELAYLLNLAKPRTVMPIHGEFSMLNRHQSWLNKLARGDQKILLRANGDEIILSKGECYSGGQIPVELLPIDGNQLVPISNRSLKERKDMMYSGLVIISGVRGFGKMTWEVTTAGIAEESNGAMQRLVSNFLNQKCQNTNPSRLKRELKKAIRPHYRGMPVIKIILEGNIL